MRLPLFIVLMFVIAGADGVAAGRLSGREGRREKRREARRASRRLEAKERERSAAEDNRRDSMRLEGQQDERDAKSGRIDDRRVGDRRLDRDMARKFREEAKAPREKLEPEDLRKQTRIEDAEARAEDLLQRRREMYRRDTVTIILDF
jgi:hypothetical protein